MALGIRPRRPAIDFSGVLIQATPRSAIPLVPHSRTITTQDLDDGKGDRERVVILGSGWAGQ